MSRILVVEDDQTLREQLLELMAFEGYQGVGAEDGAQALERVHEAPPDLVLCDVGLPTLDGFSVIRQLRANPSTAETPIIVLTARQDLDTARRMRDLAVRAYITKPFALDVLLDAIHNALTDAPSSTA